MYESEKALLDDIVKYSNGKLSDSIIEKFSESDFKAPEKFIIKLMSEILVVYKYLDSFPLMFASVLGDYTEEKDIDFTAIVNNFR